MAGLGRRTFAPGEVLTASNVMNYLQDQAVMNFAGTAARGSAIGTAVSEGMVSYLADSNALEVYDGSDWVNIASAATPSYRYVTTLYFASSGTFTKASYPWLRAIRVKCQAAGGGGGGADSAPPGTATIGRSAGGGAYAESFITNIAALDASITVTRGAGGAGGVGAAGGTNGGNSSFGSIVSASGGILGGNPGISGVPGTISGAIAQSAGTGDIVIPGSGAEPRYAIASGNVSNARGGDSFMGAGGDSTTVFSTINGSNGSNGYLYGGGGSGAYNSGNTGLNRTGGAGANGIVIVELYA